MILGGNYINKKIEFDDINEKEILKYIFEHDIINIAGIQEKIIMQKNKEYLEKHAYSIWQGKDGKFYTYVEEKTGRRMIKRTSKESIEAFIIEYYKAKELTPCIDDVAFAWLNEKKEMGDIRPQSYDKYVNTYKKYIINNELAKSLRKKHLQDITEQMLDEVLYPTIKTYGMSRKAFSDLLTIIKGIFQYGKRKHYTELSISHYIDDMYKAKHLFTEVEKSEEEQVFSHREEEMLKAELLKEDSLRALGVYLLFETGMRVGELACLKKEDVSDDVIKVHRTEIKYKSEETHKNVIDVQESTKTQAGKRIIVAKGRGAEVLVRILELSDDSEWLFSENGKRICESGFRRKLYRACEAVGIPKRSPHKIRKTYATGLMYNGVNEDIIKGLMGHTDIATTRRNYVIGNASVDIIRREFQKVANL